MMMGNPELRLGSIDLHPFGIGRRSGGAVVSVIG